MARSVMKAGYPVAAFDIDPAARESITIDGAEVFPSPREIAGSCTVIITMLPSPRAVREAVFGGDGILREINDSKLLVEMSTVDLELTLEVARAVEERGGMFLDAPVAGTPDRVPTRDLEILVSGNKRAVFERFSGLFDALGKRIVFVGKAGTGKILKLTANAMIAINKMAAVEATSVALKNGIDPEILLDVLGHSTANSVVFERYGRTILGEETPITNRHSWHLKDLQLMQELCAGSGCSFYLGALTHEIIQSACSAQPDGVETLGAYVKFYERANHSVRRSE